jgi:hemolysin activation/secretion protein
MLDHHVRSGALLGCIALLTALLSPAAMGQQDARFPIRSFRVEGNHLVDTALIDAALQTLVGPDKDFDTLRRAVETVEALYADAGYSAVRVLLPEQDVTEGSVQLKVIEAKLGRVIVEGNRHFSTENIRASVPALVEGESPQLEKAGASLALANESFAKQSRLTLQKGDSIGSVNAQIRVADDTPWRFAASLDNTGSTDTGRHRLGLVYQHANLFDRDHAFSAQFITSTERPSDVAILGLGYKIPIYRLGDSIEMAYGKSSVDSGNISTAAGNYGISGRGEFASLRYNLGLPRWQGNEQKLVVAAEWKTFESHVVPTGGAASLIPDLSSAPFSLGYQISSPEGMLSWKAGISHAWNLSSGKNGTDSAYNQVGARPGADADFRLWRWNLSTNLLLPGEWRLNAAANGQQTNDLLISGEQFGIGGADSVRGYTEREVLNDRGWRGSIELASPSFNVPDTDWRGHLVAFHDLGTVYRNEPLAGEQRKAHISSVGLGTRIQIGRTISLRADIAHALRSAASTDDGDVRAHLQMMVLF